MGLGSILGSVGSLGAGIIGHFAAQDDQDKANQLLQDAYQEILKVGASPDQSKAIILNKFEQAGLLDPALEKKIDAGVSQVSQIQENPELGKAQMNALELLKQRSQGGLTSEEQANFAKTQAEAQRTAEAKNQQILQQMQARGMGGSGAELAAQLASSQGASNQVAQGGLDISATAAEKALQALGQYGNLAGQVRGQDFSVNQAKASAADEMNRFNVSNQMSQQARNVSAQNQAQASNLANKQNVMNANTSQANQELYRQQQAQRQKWLDDMASAQARAGAKLGQSGGFANQANQTGQFWSGIGKGVNLIGQTFDNSGNPGSGSTSKVGSADYNKLDEGEYSNLKSPELGSQYAFAEGGEVPNPEHDEEEAMHKAHLAYKFLKRGGKVPGKPIVPGNSYKNDVVPGMLSPGEIVVPNTHSHDPELAKQFVEKIIKKQ